MTRMRAALAVAVGCLLLVGCSPSTGSTPSPVASSASTAPSPTSSPGVECERLAAKVGRAVQDVVDAYNVTPGGGTLPSATPPPSVAPTPSRTPSRATATPAAVGSEAVPADRSGIQVALDLAGLAVAEGRCASTEMQAGIERGLDAVGAEGPIAEAVRARVIAGLHGEIAAGPDDTVVGPGGDLVHAAAVAPAGTIIRLLPGDYDLASTLVLLDSVTIRGAGRDETTLTSDAPDAAVLSIAGGGAKLADLAIVREATSTGSGIIVGVGSLVLDGVRVGGAHARSGSGGAGVLMAASSTASGRGTTLEVTDSEFVDNDWAGLAVAGRQQVSIVGSAFTGNGECGLCFLDASGGSVRDSSFIDNRVGVYITGTARPAVLQSDVEGGEVGLQIDRKAAPVVEGNRVTGASKAGIIIAGSATGAIVDTTCARVPYGIVVGSSAAPTLTDNECSLARGE